MPLLIIYADYAAECVLMYLVSTVFFFLVLSTSASRSSANIDCPGPFCYWCHAVRADA